MDPQLSNCINYFNKLILNELKDVCNCWIGGGAVRDYFSVGYITKDIDLYFPNEEEYEKCRIYFSNKWSKELFDNQNVKKIVYNKRNIDLIKHYFAGPSEAIQEFDFTVCCVAVDRDNVYTHPTFFMDLAKRALVINKLPYPLATMWRMQKYIQKGYRICSGGMKDIAMAISKLELHKDDDQPNIAIIETEFYPDGTPKFVSFD